MLNVYQALESFSNVKIQFPEKFIIFSICISGLTIIKKHFPKKRPQYISKCVSGFRIIFKTIKIQFPKILFFFKLFNHLEVI